MPAIAPDVRLAAFRPIRALRALGERWYAWGKASRWNQLLGLAVLVYGVVFSILTSLRILALSAYAWDLGLFNQAFYTTVFKSRFFYVSPLPGAPPASLFSGHFSPILLVLLPVYAAFPSLYTLVVLQTWAIAIAALPIYLLGQRLLGSNRVAFVFALVFLLNPATQGVNWFDFHSEAFLPLTFGAALYFYEARSWRGFFLASLAALSTIEMAAVLLALIAIAGLGSETWSVKVRRENPDRPRIYVLLGTLSLSAAWSVLAWAAVGALGPPTGFWSGDAGYWSILGASNLPSVPLQVLLHPDLAVSALLYDGTLKAWYLIVLFVPLQFLTLRSPRSTLYCLPWLGVSLFSNYRSYYLVGNQYPAFVLPFLFYGAIVGLARPWRVPQKLARLFRWSAQAQVPRPEASGLARTMIGLCLILLIVVSPLGPWAIGSDTTGRFPAIGNHERAILSLYSLIPADASVLTQNNLYPFVSSRIDAHFVPTNILFPPGGSFNRSMDTWIASVEFILADTQTNFLEAALLLSWPGVAVNYSVVGAADGAILLERGSHGVASFRPLDRVYDYRDVVSQNASLVRDPDATEGVALQHANLSTSHFWFGPFVLLPPGDYIVTYRLEVDRPSAGPILSLPVLFHPMVVRATQVGSATQGEQTFFDLVQLSNQTEVTLHVLAGEADPAAGAYFAVSTAFQVRDLGVYEFPAHVASGSVVIRFDRLEIEQQKPLSSGSIPIVWSSA